MQTISIDINKVQKGDETEFRLLFNLFYPRLMSVACRFVPEHIAEDIVQSVFVMYWEQKSALIPNAIHSFLYKCTQNNCLNYGSPDKPGGLSIQLCKSEKKEFYIRYSS